MRKIKLLLATMLSIFAWTGVMATVTQPTLTTDPNNPVLYTIKNFRSGNYATYTGRSTQLSQEGSFNKASLWYFIENGAGVSIVPYTDPTVKLVTHSSANETGAVWYLVENPHKSGYFCVSLSNNASSNCWDDQGNHTKIGYWQPSANDNEGTSWIIEPCNIKNPVNVTYDMYDGETKVASAIVVQEANSAASAPQALTGITYNGFFHEKFYYNYTPNGTIGNTDCTITITRTEKAGVVKSLSDLSNTKAYNIGCDRGAMIAYNGSMVSTALNDATANAQPYGKFALLKYEDNYYIFSIDEGKFIKNDASLALDLTTVGFSTEDAMVMTAQTDNAPYFLWHFNAGSKYLNTNGNQPLGYVINNYSTPDPGNLYYMVAVDDFDPTAALAELDAYFHPSYFVTYKVKDTNGNVLFTSEPQPTKAGAKITTLLPDFQRPFYTYSEEDVTITEQNTTVEFTATWNGPFKLSKDFDNAQWQNMAMRSTWYVTSAIKDDSGAYKTQNANTMGLVEDSYQWAFIGNGYDGFKIINKAEGDGKSLGWTNDNQKDAGIPTIMADNEGNHAWKVVASTNTSVPAGSFCLNVAGTSLYINQYGGVKNVNGVQEGGSLKFWNATGNIADAGSAFTVFDVPSNFASFVADEIAPSMDATGYFSLTDAAKATIGYDESKKTECSFVDYKSMKEKLTADFLSNISNYVLPETGYYILKNKYYGTYMGIDPSDANMYGNYKTANLAKNVVKLTKTGDATYTISLMDKYAPATVAQSVSVTASTEAGTYTVVIPTPGYAAFQADPSANMSCLHCRAAGDIVGWEAPAEASKWSVTDAESVELTIGSEGYATAYLPFPVEFGGLLPVPEAKGVWTFDDPDNLLAGTGVATIQATTHEQNSVTVATPATANITAVDGPATGNGAVEVPVGSSLLMTANTGATSIGTYTIMWDVCADDASTYIPLLQNNLNNAKDGSFFINKYAVGHGGDVGYNGKIQNGEWNRVVFVVEPYGASVYLNGEFLASKYGLTANNQAYYTHWLLSTGALFFADEDGEEKTIKASEIRFWDEALSASQIKQLGTISGDAVAEVKIPEAKGAWTFDDANNPMAGTGVSTMKATNSVVVNNDGSVTVPVGDQLEMTTNLTETSLDTYTLMMDVKFPDVNGYTSIFQNKLENNDDASLFIKNGQIGVNYAKLGYNGTIEANTWYRVVFVVDNLYATLYVDGNKVSQSTSQGDLHWRMSTGLLFFRDNDVDEKVVTTTGISFWDEALTQAQVAKLATVGTAIETNTPDDYNVTAYTAQYKDTWLELNKLDGTIPTKTPVILKGAPETYVYNIVAEAPAVSGNVLQGTLEEITADGSQYILAKPAGEAVGFYQATTGSIKPGKVYLTPGTVSVKAYYFYNEDATGIKNIENTTKNIQYSNDAIYNLSGQRINKLQKGINIVNGKKILK